MRTTTPRSGTRAADSGIDFTELARIIWERGLLRRRYGYYSAKIIGLPALLIAGLVAFVLIGETWWQLVAAVVLAVIFTQIAFLGRLPHTGRSSSQENGMTG